MWHPLQRRVRENAARRRKFSWRSPGLEPLEPRCLLAAIPLISEFMASNTKGLRDADGETSDWIEIYNPGTIPLDLAGWHLSDDIGNLVKWQFPAVTLAAGARRVVFASGKDRVNPAAELHTNFQLATDGEYLGLIAPDGTTITTQFAPAYPPQRSDVSYGLQQRLARTVLAGSDSAAKALVPTAAVAPAWSGGAEPFDDAAWNSASLSLGYDTRTYAPANPTAVPLTSPTVTYAQTDYGIAETLDGIVSGNDNGWAVYGGRTTAQTAVFRTTAPLTTPYLELRLIHNTTFSEHTIAEFRLSVTTDAVPSVTGNNTWLPLTAATLLSTGGSILTDVGSQRIRATGPNANNNTYIVRAAVPAGAITGIRLEVFPFDSNGDGTATLGRNDQDAGNGNFVLSEFTATALASLVTELGPVNVAQGKAVTAAGATYSGQPKEYLTDGSNDTFTHNLTPTRAFWYRVDLGQTYALDRIELTNRNDDFYPDRLTNYRVTVLADAGGSPGTVVWSADVRTDGSNSGVGGLDVLRAALDADGSFEGRFVQVQAIDNGTNRYLQIAELRVFDVGAGASYDPLIQTDLETAMKGVSPSVYVRSTFDVTDPEAAAAFTLRMRYDDGFVAYVNGAEVARRNAPAGTPGYQAAATASHYASVFEEFDVPRQLLRAGANVLAIQGLNVSAGDGDFLLLTELTSDSILPDQPAWFTTPTPGQINQEGVIGFVADTRFSMDRGFYSSALDTVIICDTPGATIVYTTDGSAPSPTHGTRVEAPNSATPPAATVHITTTTTLRAMAFKEGFEPSNIDTGTYLFLGDVIRQPANPPGFPSTWNGFTADYAMDQRVANDPAYRDEIIAGLRSIPTMSIVMDFDDLFGPVNGIYTFPEQRGVQWHRPASVELILPDGSTGFQVDAGLGMWGYGWRPHSSTHKHALRLFFQSAFGETKLNYPMFADSPVDEFDTLILRAQGSRGWTDFRDSITGTQYIHDAWARDTARDMGKLDGHSTYVHLYLNGLYWGLYNPVERPDGNFGAAYLGGSEEDYDALNHRVGLPVEALDGDLVAWNAMQALADAGLSTPAQYAAIQQYVDIDALIDYMLVQQYSTNADGPDNGSNNMRLLRKREEGGQFTAFFWDMEYSFWNASDNRNINVDVANTISHVYAKLRANAEFRLRYADRAQKHLFNGGALTPAAAAARWQARANEIYSAVIAESARWGDYRRPAQPYTRNVEWMAELNRLMTSYFPVRSSILVGQLRAASLYSSIDAPTFRINGVAQHGGSVLSGAALTITATAGTVYYTLDGSDPRAVGGAARGTLYTGAIPLTESTVVKARLLSGGVWSALLEAEFLVGGVPGSLRPVVTELNYNPAAPSEAERALGFTSRGDFEFIELANTSPSRAMDLHGIKFADGVTFDFTTGDVTSLAPGERVLVVANRAAFETRYGTGLRIAGEYTGGLDKGGERIALADANDLVFADFSYDDSGAWPSRADGLGSTLELVSPGSGYSAAANWRSSSEYGGSPGRAGVGPRADVVVNEVLANSPAPLVDAIELYNTTAAPIDLGGWGLSDSSDDYLKFRIPAGTVIQGHGHLVLYQGHWVDGSMEFAAHEFGGGATGFGLNASRGDDVWLIEADASGKLLRFADHFEFGATAAGESVGRWPSGSGDVTPLTRPTLDAPSNANQAEGSGPRVGPLLISEVMYSPKALVQTETNAGFLTPEDMEFVEVFNPTDAVVDLTRWQLAKGIDYTFAAGSSLAAGGKVVVVSFDPANAAMLAAFRTRYGNTTATVVGPYSGHLSNTGDRVQLLRPGTPPVDDPAFYPGLLEDEVRYVASWGAAGDGKGLSRLAADAWGGLASSWGAAVASPGTVRMVAGRHVFYNNSAFDGRSPAADAQDDAAIAADKSALLPGRRATFDNYTSYGRGINGLMIDLASPVSTVTAADFAVRAGNDNAPSAWNAAPAPTVFSRALANGLTRVTLVWADNAIGNQWLEVKVLVTARTGLPGEDVFYFGNALGETGDRRSGPEADAVVDAADEAAIRAGRAAGPVSITNPLDFNRDRRINAADELLSRANYREGESALALLDLSGAGAATALLATAVGEEAGEMAIMALAAGTPAPAAGSEEVGTQYVEPSAQPSRRGGREQRVPPVGGDGQPVQNLGGTHFTRPTLQFDRLQPVPLVQQIRLSAEYWFQTGVSQRLSAARSSAKRIVAASPVDQALLSYLELREGSGGDRAW